LGAAVSAYWMAALDQNIVFTLSVLAVLTVLYVHQLNGATQMMSDTTFEGRFFCGIMHKMSGFDNYRVLSAMSVLDLGGSLTRALFVTHALHVSMDLEDKFSEHTGQWLLGGHWVNVVGFGGVAVFWFGIGLLLQFAYLMYSFRVVRHDLTAAKKRSGSRSNMQINTCMDDLGAMAEWAKLKPVAQTFALASLPMSYDDLNDVYRVWDGMRTTVLRNMVKLYTDTVVSLFLQTLLFELTFSHLPWMDQAKFALSFFFSWAAAMQSCVGMLRMNTLLSVSGGLATIFLMLNPCVRAVGAFVCESHLFDLSALTCSPVVG